MSALGQKQTCAAQNGMSALPPIATAKADFPKKSCLLPPQKRTYAVQLGMSALGQKQTCVLRQPMSALRPRADIAKSDRNVRFVKLCTQHLFKVRPDTG